MLIFYLNLTFKDLDLIAEASPSIDVSHNTLSSPDLSTKYSFSKDPVYNQSNQDKTQFWDPKKELAGFPIRLCGKTSSNDKALFTVEYARRLYVFNPIKALDIL